MGYKEIPKKHQTRLPKKATNAHRFSESLCKAEAVPTRSAGRQERDIRKRPSRASNLTRGVHRSRTVRAPTRRIGRVVRVGGEIAYPPHALSVICLPRRITVE